MIVLLIRVVHLFARVLIGLLVARAILSWFVNVDQSGNVRRLYTTLAQITEPMNIPARKLLDKLGLNTGMIDFSLLVTFFLTEIAEQVLIRILLLFV